MTSSRWLRFTSRIIPRRDWDLTKRRQIPDGAKCRTARMPKGADAEGRAMPGCAKGGPLFTRTLALRALWHLAPFGIPRRLAFGAVSSVPITLRYYARDRP